MQKIVIKNFGAVESAEIEVKNILVLIGEQASGKSTIAKLIYFFKSLKDDLFNQIYRAENEEFDRLEDLIYLIRNKFYDFFGSTLHLPDFTIKFYYDVDSDKYISLSLDNRKRLKVNIDYLVDNNFLRLSGQIKRLLFNKLNSNDISEQLAFEQNKLKFAQRLSSLVNDLFASHQNNSLFVVAGRNATVSYSELFEKYLFANVQNSLTENSQNKVPKKEQTVDETLMLKFIERVVKIKDVFRKFGNFEGLIESYEENEIAKQRLYHVKNRIDELLKGKYTIDNWGEKIVFNQELGEYVFLSNASSGQQESIRILQDIFMNILENQKLLRIVEEPEAHLFPIAQKQLTELLVFMTNQDSDNQLIITTHSPYVLTVFNNLLFAKRVVDKNPSAEIDVTPIIPKEYWIDANNFMAYSIGTQNTQTAYCETIFSTEKATIKQNYLDTVSEILGGDFNTLYSIHAKTFARK